MSVLYRSPLHTCATMLAFDLSAAADHFAQSGKEEAGAWRKVSNLPAFVRHRVS